MSPADVPPVARPPGAVRFTRPPFPSPARHIVAFAIAIAEEGPVDVSILDVSGRRVATVWRGELPRGERTFAWSGDTEAAARATAGIYWVLVRTGSSRESRPFGWRP